MEFRDEFISSITSALPLLAIESTENERVVEALSEYTEYINQEILPKAVNTDHYLRTNGFTIQTWDILNGWKNADRQLVDRSTADPLEAVKYLIKETTISGIYILQNYHFFMEDRYILPQIVQLFKEVYELGKQTHIHICLVGNTIIPNELKNYFNVLTFPLPTVEELLEVVNEYAPDSVSEEDRYNAANALAGLTKTEAISAICISLVKGGGKTINSDFLFEKKAEIVKKSGLLEYIPNSCTIEDIGGLVDLKKWAKKIAKVFKNTKKAIKYKLPMPKSCLILGVAGGGKSLSAKAIAALCGVPLYRWDVGKLFGSLVGDTEQNTRRLFALIDAIGMCVILCDEAEKLLAGSGSSDKTDGGITSRFMASFLYYMNERKSKAFFVFTSNDIESLSAPVIRRQDAVWYVDLPSEEERKDIWSIQIAKTGRKSAKYDLNKLVSLSDGYTGAEIENSIKDAMFDAFFEDREYTQKDIESSIKNIIPVSKIKNNEVDALRSWAVGRARKANSQVAKTKKTVKSAVWYNN